LSPSLDKLEILFLEAKAEILLLLRQNVQGRDKDYSTEQSECRWGAVPALNIGKI
jgi:hypothetical protein